jgi:protein TonB
MVTTDFPADPAGSGRYRLIRYGVVLAISSTLHFLAWHYRDALEQRPEPQPKPIQTIEVTLTPPPPPSLPVPDPKGPEPGPAKAAPKSAEPKPRESTPVAVAKPVAKPPRPRPETKPAAKPRTKPEVEPPPEPRPQTKPEPEFEPELQAKPEPKPRYRSRHTDEPDPNLVQETRPEPPAREADRSPAKPAPAETGAASAREPEVAPAPARSVQDHGAEFGGAGRAGQAEKNAGSNREGFEEVKAVGACLSGKPDYPSVAEQRGWGGAVKIEAKIRANGSVADAMVRQSSGHDILDEAALRFFMDECRFIPAKRNGQPIDRQVSKTFRFKPPED